MSCVSSLSIGFLPIAGSAAAAGIAAAEAAESAITRIGAAESTGTATAPGAARHHVTEDQCGQEAAAPAAPASYSLSPHGGPPIPAAPAPAAGPGRNVLRGERGEGQAAPPPPRGAGG